MVKNAYFAGFLPASVALLGSIATPGFFDVLPPVAATVALSAFGWSAAKVCRNGYLRAANVIDKWQDQDQRIAAIEQSICRIERLLEGLSSVEAKVVRESSPIQQGHSPDESGCRSCGWSDR